MTNEQTAPHIRWMIRADMNSVLMIETQCFEFPWCEEDFLRCLRQRNCIGMVAVDHQSDPLGFMLYELHSTRLHLLSIAVDVDHRHNGIGTAMVEKLLGKLSGQRRNRLTVDVRETNLDAQLFFKSRGMVAVETLRGIYDDNDVDAYRFEWRWRGEPQEAPINRIAERGLI